MTPSRARMTRKLTAAATQEATATVVPVVALPVPHPPAAAQVVQSRATRSPTRKMSELDIILNCVYLYGLRVLGEHLTESSNVQFLRVSNKMYSYFVKQNATTSGLTLIF